MQKYDISILLDGWFKLRVDAQSRLALIEAINTAKISVCLTSSSGELIGELVHVDNDSDSSMFTLELEEVEKVIDKSSPYQRGDDDDEDMEDE